jgi:hypothetical protein
MNTENTELREPRLKTLAIIGLLAAIAVIAWLAVQIVAYAPSTFTSLASLAEGISQYKDSVLAGENKALVITSNISSLESNKPATITWTKDEQPGTYAFSYSCADGVTVDIVASAGLKSISCDTRYSLGDTDNVTLVIESTKVPETNLSYAISFMRANDIGPIRIGEQTMAVKNEGLAVAAPVEDGEVLGESDQNEFVADEIVKPEAPKPTTPAPVVVTNPEPTLVYEIPVSNPNGFTDLATRFIGTGSIVNNKFVTGTIGREDSGAIQFEVKNIGTKTSDSWSYSVTLPDGDVYTSPRQVALKPNERAVISLGFDTPDKASYTFVVVVKVEDKTAANNSFKKVVSFIN